MGRPVSGGSHVVGDGYDKLGEPLASVRGHGGRVCCPRCRGWARSLLILREHGPVSRRCARALRLAGGRRAVNAREITDALKRQTADY